MKKFSLGLSLVLLGACGGQSKVRLPDIVPPAAVPEETPVCVRAEEDLEASVDECSVYGAKFREDIWVLYCSGAIKLGLKEKKWPECPDPMYDAPGNTFLIIDIPNGEYSYVHLSAEEDQTCRLFVCKREQ